MKKKQYLVLSILFLVPLLFYIFLSKGIYHYANLPILTEDIVDLKGNETFEEHYSVVCFLGNDLKDSQNKLFNLNEVIYKRFNASIYFQVVVILPKGTDFAAQQKRLGMYADASKWKFVLQSDQNIQAIFESFDSPYSLERNFSSDYAFIIDTEMRLRGRKDDEDIEGGKLYGYDMNSVAVLKNKMRDDIEVIYYQLKKSMEKEERFKKLRENSSTLKK